MDVQEFVTNGLSADHRGELADIEANRQYYWEARNDAAYERSLTAARYYIMGATGVHIAEDAELKAVLKLCSGEAL